MEARVWALEKGGPVEGELAQNGIPVAVEFSNISEIECFRPDIVHIHRCGAVSRRDTLILRAFKEKYGSRIIETSVFGLADLTWHSPIDVHAHISRWDLWRWRRYLRPFHQAGIYLPNCVDTEAIRPTPSDFRMRHGIPDDSILLGRIGKTDWKELSRAVVPAMEKAGNVFFATVDDYSDDCHATEAWPDTIKPRVIRIPVLKGSDELSAFYSACDATLNFSPIGESFGFVVAESMSCGTPCIAHSTPRSDNAQIEVASIACGGYPVRDAAAAEKTILDIAATPPTAERKVLCRRSIVERYSLSRHSSSLLKAYSVLVGSGRTKSDIERRYREAGFETCIPEQEIRNLFRSVMGGKPSLLDHIFMFLIHSLPNALRIQRNFLRRPLSDTAKKLQLR